MNTCLTVVALAWLALSAGASEAQRPPAAPGAELRADTFVVSGTPVAVDAGRITVPANRTSGSGATLRLAFVRFRSTAAAPGARVLKAGAARPARAGPAAAAPRRAA
jgi:hypothetical protein